MYLYLYHSENEIGYQFVTVSDRVLNYDSEFFIEVEDPDVIQMVLDYNGFITVEHTEDGVSITPNIEAWEAWKQEEAEKPQPEPPEEPVTWAALSDAYKEGVNGA